MDLTDTATDIMSQPGVISSASDEGPDLIKLKLHSGENFKFKFDEDDEI